MAEQGSQQIDGDERVGHLNQIRKRKNVDHDRDDIITGNDTQEKRCREEARMDAPHAWKGPCWRLPAAKERKDMNSCQDDLTLLEMALSCTKQTTDVRFVPDVRFVFNDDIIPVFRGHWSVLRRGCEFFERMYLCGTKEALIGEVRVVGVSLKSFRALLEWLYLEYAGKEMAQADGREMWTLADSYQVESLKTWLMNDGIVASCVWAAAQFALEGSGQLHEELLQACQTKANSFSTLSVDEECLRGVNACILRDLLDRHRRAGSGVLEGDRAMERFQVVERWARANALYACDGACDDDDIRALIEVVDLTLVPPEYISKVVRPSRLVAASLFETIGQGGLADVELHLIKSFGSLRISSDFPGHRHMAVGVVSQRERVAVTEAHERRVVVYDAESGECVFTVGSEKGGPGQLIEPYGVAFNKCGHLIVSDIKLRRIQVYDSQGVFVRSFGTRGDGLPMHPSDIAVNSDNNIIVCECSNNSLEIFEEDGTFIRTILPEVSLSHPTSVAAAGEGRLVVANYGCTLKPAKVLMMSSCGKLVTNVGSRGGERGQYEHPTSVCVGAKGEILLLNRRYSDKRHDVQVFSQSGRQLMGCIGRGGDLFDAIPACYGVAAGAGGRVYVLKRYAVDWVSVMVLGAKMQR